MVEDQCTNILPCIELRAEVLVDIAAGRRSDLLESFLSRLERLGKEGNRVSHGLKLFLCSSEVRFELLVVFTNNLS